MRTIPVQEDLRQYEVKNTVEFRGWKSLLLSIDCEKNGLFFVTHIQQVREIVEFANANGFRAIGLWGKSEPMNEEQQRVRDWLIEQRTMPPEYSLLVLNKAYETSITIGGVEYVIVHYQEAARIIQARGRVRGDLETLYRHAENAPIEVPQAYLNRPLSKEERDELAEILCSGTSLKWTSIKNQLPKTGYEIEKTRNQNKRYETIRKIAKT